MKTFTTLLGVLALSAGFAAAQDLSGNANNSVAGPTSTASTVTPDVNGYRSPSTLGPQSSKGFRSTMPNPNPNLKPKLGGIFVDGAKYGTQLINPAAPASYGYGEKYLTAPDPRYDVMHESGPAAHRQSGGLKLFSLEF